MRRTMRPGAELHLELQRQTRLLETSGAATGAHERQCSDSHDHSYERNVAPDTGTSRCPPHPSRFPDSSQGSRRCTKKSRVALRDFAGLGVRQVVDMC